MFDTDDVSTFSYVIIISRDKAIYYFQHPIMRYVLGGCLQAIYSWDCIMLQWTEYPLFQCKYPPSPKVNCIMGLMKKGNKIVHIRDRSP